MKTELIRTKRERAWGWPAVINFTLGGAGAGLYLLSFVYDLLQTSPNTEALRNASNILSPILISIGFFAVSLESGQPSRSIYILSNLKSSWISIELMAGILFIITALADLFFHSAVLHMTATASALGIILSQGFVIFHSRAITAWNLPIMPFLFFTSALAMGGGMLVFISFFLRSIAEVSVFRIMTACLIADITAWALYIAAPRDIQFKNATAFLRRPLSIFLVSGLGQLIPLMMLFWLMMSTGKSHSPGLVQIITAFTGLCIIAGGVCQKVLVILRANFLRDIVMGLPKNNTATLKNIKDTEQSEHLMASGRIHAGSVTK